MSFKTMSNHSSLFHREEHYSDFKYNKLTVYKLYVKVVINIL